MELSVTGVRFSYRHKQVLSDVSFAVEGGTFCALLGPNGAGKSTLFSLLCHLSKPAAGTIDISGHNIADDPCAALARIGIVFQQPTLDLDTSVQNNLTYFAGLHGIRGRAAQSRIDQVLDRMEMRARAHEKVRTLNGGHRRRMEIARALIHEPAILLLDEPTVGLDPQARRAITDHVHALANDGLAVLWATHLVDEVHESDQVIILNRGHIVAKGTAAEIAQGQPLRDRFFALISAHDHRETGAA